MGFMGNMVFFINMGPNCQNGFLLDLMGWLGCLILYILADIAQGIYCIHLHLGNAKDLQYSVYWRRGRIETIVIDAMDIGVNSSIVINILYPILVLVPVPLPASFFKK